MLGEAVTGLFFENYYCSFVIISQSGKDCQMTKDTAQRIMDIVHEEAIEREFINKKLEIYGVEICEDSIHLWDHRKGKMLEEIARLLQLTIKYQYYEDSKSYLITFSYKNHQYFGGVR